MASIQPFCYYFLKIGLFLTQTDNWNKFQNKQFLSLIFYIRQDKIVYKYKILHLCKYIKSMSYVTYHPNQTVYIKNIGYGILINCGQLKSISRKVDNVNIKKQSIYFDPEMFNTHSSSDQSNKSNKSHSQQKPKPKQKKQQQKISKPQSLPQKQAQKIITEKQKEPKKQQSIKVQIQNVIADSTNIVCVKLQCAKTNVKVFVPDNLITKTIDLIIQPMMDATRQQIVVQIQITKTIQNLKKLIFTQLNLQMANFYNVRLLSMSPIPTDLNNNSNKISQYLLKDCSKLILVADYAFIFNAIKSQQVKAGKFALSNNSLTLNSYKVASKIQQNKQTVANNSNTNNSPTKPDARNIIAVIQNIVKKEQKQGEIQPKVQQKIEQETVQKQLIVQSKEKTQQLQIQKSKSQTSSAQHQNNYLTLSCAIAIQSGRYYWEFKLDKLPTIDDDYSIGVYWENLQKQKKEITYYQYSIMSKKREIIVEYGDSLDVNAVSEFQEDYGLPVKSGDVIGVLISIRKGKTEIVFYKSCNLVMVCLGVCHSIDMKEKHIRSLVPFATLSGQSQITLDSRASLPLDSLRST